MRRLIMPATCLATAAVTLIALPACDQAAKQARASASQAAGQATDKVKDEAQAKAAQLVVDQVCALTEKGGPLADDTVTRADSALVKPLVGAARTAGVGPKVVGTLQTLADDGASEADRAAALEQLRATCSG